MPAYTCYHGTDRSRYENIKKHGFFLTKKPNLLPCDLGHGAYFFIKRNDFDNPKKNAEKYVTKYKHDYSAPVIVEVSCVANEDKVMNMNDDENEQLFQSFKEANYSIINDEAKQIFDTPSLDRGNLDGLVIEVLLRTFNIKPDIIIKDTYTSFDKIAHYKRSNFYNGRELCLKNKRAVKNMCLLN